MEPLLEHNTEERARAAFIHGMYHEQAVISTARNPSEHSQATLTCREQGLAICTSPGEHIRFQI